MFYIELYRKYLYNSTKGISNTDKEEKLIYERQKVVDILNELPDMFDEAGKILLGGSGDTGSDAASHNNGNNLIYTCIRKEIIEETVKRGGLIGFEAAVKAVQEECEFFLGKILEEIDMMLLKKAA